MTSKEFIFEGVQTSPNVKVRVCLLSLALPSCSIKIKEINFKTLFLLRLRNLGRTRHMNPVIHRGTWRLLLCIMNMTFVSDIR